MKDEMFEALAKACRWDIKYLTKTSRGRLNAALKELREIEATVTDINRAGNAWSRVYPNIVPTPQGLTGNWPGLMSQSYVSPQNYSTPEHHERDPDAARRFQEIVAPLSLGWTAVEAEGREEP